MNLSQPLEKSAADHPDSVAIHHPAGEITYGVLFDVVRRLARGLQRCGVERGDRVVLMLPNIPHFPIAYHAILRLGAVVAPVGMGLKGPELGALLEDCEASTLIVWGGALNELRPCVEMVPTMRTLIVLGEELPRGAFSLTSLIARSQPLTEPAEGDDDDPAVIWYGAGETRRPKGAELTHGSLVANAVCCRDVMAVTEADLLLGTLPLSHPMGQTLLMNLAFGSGAALHLYPRFDPMDIACDIQAGRGTVLVGFPSQFRALCDIVQIDADHPSKSLRLCVCGGGHLSEETLKEFERKFGGYILECYTMNETSPVCSFNQWRTGRRVGSLGHPLPGVEMRVMDSRGNEAAIGEVGEIAVKGVNVMRGYVGRPRLTAQRMRGGWFRTGDLGRMDINGFFYLVGRREGRILSDGAVVHSAEVESLLRGHPEVADVAVVGIPDSSKGEAVKACVVLRTGATVTTEQLVEYCRTRSAQHKAPTIVRFYRDLPRGEDGRLSRTQL